MIGIGALSKGTPVASLTLFSPGENMRSQQSATVKRALAGTQPCCLLVSNFQPSD